MAPAKKSIEKAKRRVERATEHISVAAIRSWLKAQGLPHLANTREQVVERLAKLMRRDEVVGADRLPGQ